MEDNPEERTKFLQELLIEETCKLYKNMKTNKIQVKIEEIKSQIINIWSNLFAPLLKVGTRHEGVPYEVCLMLAKSQFPPREDWPQLIKILSKLMFCKASQDDIDYLSDHEIFFRLNETHKNDPNTEFTFPSEPYNIINGLLSLTKGVLSKEWALRLLTSKIDIPDQFDTPKIREQLIHGLFSFRNINELLINDGSLKKNLTIIFNQKNSIFDRPFKISPHEEENGKKERTKELMKYLKQVYI